VTGDTDALKPFTFTSSTRRSAFSRLAKTPSCTPQAPDSPLPEAAAAVGAVCGFAAGFSAALGFSAAAVRVGLGAAAAASGDADGLEAAAESGDAADGLEAAAAGGADGLGESWRPAITWADVDFAGDA
jgi:hypothetical protein